MLKPLTRRFGAVACLGLAAWVSALGAALRGDQTGRPAASALGRSSYWLFEAGQVRPLALSRDDSLLYAVNTPDNRLEIYRTQGNHITHVSSVAVGLEPVAVAQSPAGEVWVVNHLSDSVSIVDVSNIDNPRVVRTLLVGDEPRDIVFAGPGRSRAFVTTAHRGQNVPYDPQLTTPGIGRADVWVYDALAIGPGLGGTPLSPTGLALSSDGRRLYALTRFDNAISVIDTRQRREISHTAMPNPEPASVRVGRRFLYDATLSAKGDSFCASCHVFGDKDELAWDLGNPDENILDNQNPIPFVVPIPFLIGMDPDFPTHKGPMTTQSLRGMANHGPMHWRGDRTGSLVEPNAQPDSGAFNERAAFRQFQAGFVGLLGRSAPIPDADMEAFTDFVLQLTYPPNPIRNLDNSLTPQQQQGRDFFFGNQSDSAIASCQQCHRLDPDGNAEFGVARPGFFGSDGRSASEVFPQIFKIAHLRNTYTKVGKFGFFNLQPFVETVSDPALEGFMGDQVRGFGTNRGGDFDRVFRFMHATTFSQQFMFGPNPEGIPPGPTGDGLRLAVEAFVLAFDSNLKPIVGQQVTLGRNPSADALSRAALLVARAEAGDCDLVAKGFAPGGPRGYLYSGNGRFRTDRAGDAAMDVATLRARYDGPNRSVTLTCTPPGSGLRIGIDRDEDGVLDGDK